MLFGVDHFLDSVIWRPLLFVRLSHNSQENGN
ncbi:TPA_asm: hypothetical protein [Porphyromonas phage phage024a_F0570]|uniref:Uncharacterized protein n=1 Tax=Porphyromonas phage phage024a_F0570 TaxID=3154114 RepID=A0AAT9JMV3_9CAUD